MEEMSSHAETKGAALFLRELGLHNPVCSGKAAVISVEDR